MIKFENDAEKMFWIECIRHAEKVDCNSGTSIEAKWHKRDYITYADDMLMELKTRTAAAPSPKPD